MSRYFAVLLLLYAPTAFGGVACVVDTPTGTMTCDAIVVRDANTYTLPNITGFRANNNAGVTVPAANVAMFEIVDTDKTGAYAWTIRHSGKADWMLGTGAVSTGNTVSFRNGRVLVYDATIPPPDVTAVNGGPLMVWVNPATTAAGETSGIYVNVSSNWAATPGANNVIPLTLRATNDGQLNADLWGANIMAGNGANADPTVKPIFIHGVEMEVLNGCFPSTECETDPFGGALNKIRVNGYESIGHSGSGGRNAGAFFVWANDSTGDKWWSRGVALSHVADIGVEFRKLSGDAIEPFGTALFDASTLRAAQTVLLKTRGDTTADIRIRNNANQALVFGLDAGAGTGQNVWLQFTRNGGIGDWGIVEDSGGGFSIWEGNYGIGAGRMYMDPNDTYFSGHVMHLQEAAVPNNPTIAGCGTGATIMGSDVAGEITIGTSPGTCVLTFKQIWPYAPQCFLTNFNTAQLMRATSRSTSAFTVGGTIANADHIGYFCTQGRPTY